MTNAGKLHVTIKVPEDVIPYLGKGELHWKQGRSAKAVADRWFYAHGIPRQVQDVLEHAPDWRDPRLLEAWFERCTPLPWGKGNPTQTDLLALVSINGELAVLGIEAKVDEAFGPLVDEWLAQGGDNRLDRLVGLANLFSLQIDEIGDLRYQLFHRVAGSMLEARRFGAPRATMLVQSFCQNKSGLVDFQRFALAAGFGKVDAGGISEARTIGGIETRIGWVADVVPE